MLNTGFFYGDIFLKHQTGSHPENAGRLEHLVTEMAKNDDLSQLQKFNPSPIDVKLIENIHSMPYIQSVKESCQSGQTYLGSTDCSISSQTYDVALNAAGSLISALDKVHDKTLDNAFCAVRPPGHHAEANQALGFCYFNNIAIAADYLAKEKGYQRVLVFDFDVHHGNGTQHSFEDRKDIFYASIHQDPRTSYPGTGYASEKGSSDGLGYTLNCPMKPYSGDNEYKNILNNVLLPAFENYKPEFILLSAGFDAHRNDPLAQQELSTLGFNDIISKIKQLSYTHADGKIVSVLEGGYDYEATTKSVISHIQILQDEF